MIAPILASHTAEKSAVRSCSQKPEILADPIMAINEGGSESGGHKDYFWTAVKNS